MLVGLNIRIELKTYSMLLQEEYINALKNIKTLGLCCCHPRQREPVMLNQVNLISFRNTLHKMFLKCKQTLQLHNTITAAHKSNTYILRICIHQLLKKTSTLVPHRLNIRKI